MKKTGPSAQNPSHYKISQGFNKTSESSRRMRFYRIFARSVIGSVGRLFISRTRLAASKKALIELSRLPDRLTEQRTIWFHAASVGELESLWPLIERSANEPSISLILSVFSSSAFDHLHRSARKLGGRPPLFVGYSPLEGEWREAFESSAPNLFVTAKYEAWPEMWDALGERGTPLAIVGAKPRSSLIWAKRILGWFAGRIPPLVLFTFDRENGPGLKSRFPLAEITLESDPRWDRVFQRAEGSPPRVQALADEFAALPRPWGIVGSAWATDISALPVDASERVPGTLWVVPHKVDAKSISEMEILLRERGYTPLRTSNPEWMRPAGTIAVLVDEIGFLTELYRIMDWAWVGGGFGSSIHSTIEPAIYGLPIYGGPKGQEKFDEIPLLKRQRQLRLFDGSLSTEAAEDFLDWLTEINLTERNSFARDWSTENHKHRGASDRIWTVLSRSLDESFME